MDPPGFLFFFSGFCRSPAWLARWVVLVPPLLFGMAWLGLGWKSANHTIAVFLCVLTFCPLVSLTSSLSCRYGPPTRTDYRIIVENISSRVSWQVGFLVDFVPSVFFCNCYLGVSPVYGAMLCLWLLCVGCCSLTPLLHLLSKAYNVLEVPWLWVRVCALRCVLCGLVGYSLKLRAFKLAYLPT